MSTDIATTSRDVVDWKTGEVVNLDDATTEQLAELVTNLQDVRRALAETEQAVSAELVDRLDRDACWTLRVGDPKDGRQWEIKAASPTAGSSVYPPDMLETELRALVARGTITADAAAKALRRQVTLTLDIPLDLPLKETAEGLGQITISLGENELPIAKSDHSASAVAAGINALRKVSGTTAGLDRAKRVETGGARRARVTLKT
jgi:hypothetical protein